MFYKIKLIKILEIITLLYRRRNKKFKLEYNFTTFIVEGNVTYAISLINIWNINISKKKNIMLLIYVIQSFIIMFSIINIFVLIIIFKYNDLDCINLRSYDPLPSCGARRRLRLPWEKRLSRLIPNQRAARV